MPETSEPQVGLGPGSTQDAVLRPLKRHPGATGVVPESADPGLRLPVPCSPEVANREKAPARSSRDGGGRHSMGKVRRRQAGRAGECSCFTPILDFCQREMRAATRLS